jgi:peptidase E
MKNPSPTDVFLLAGHSRAKHDPVIEAVLSAAGRPNPTVVYVGAASGDNSIFFSMMTHSLKSAGAGKVVFAKLASPRANIDRAKGLCSDADIVHIGGGDVEAGMRVLEARGVLPFFRGLFDAGKPFFGLSAGSIMLARSWVRWTDSHIDTSAEDFPCMGFAPIVCDTHAEDEQFEELRELLKLLPARTTGYGIPSSGGLRITPAGRVHALSLPVWRFRKRGKSVERIEDLLP